MMTTATNITAAMPQNAVTAIDADLDRRLDLLLRTGCLLMSSNADTTRIKRNLSRTADYLGLEDDKINLYLDFDMLMVNYNDEQGSHTKFCACKHHGIDMTAITSISHLSWKAIRDDYTLDEYEQCLETIAHTPRHYTPWQVAMGGGLACGVFCIQFGCDWPSFFYASIAAILGLRLRTWLVEKGSNTYICIGVAAFVSTLLAWLASFISLTPAIASALPGWMISSTPWHPLLACALFIVPGVPLINFVNDMLAGHTRIGLTRALHTLLIVVAMAFGIAFAIAVCGIDNFVTDLPLVPHHTYTEYAIAAAISAMGFSMIFNVSPKMLPVVAIGGIIAVCNRNFVNLGPSTNNIGLDEGLIIGSLAGSTLVSLVAAMASHWVHTPHQCLTIPSVIPMVPGVLMYRALFAFIDMQGVVGEVTVAMNNLIKASLVILVIAIGVAIPNIFVRSMLESRRKLRYYNLLVERHNRRQAATAE